jgi:hypothetical protein
MSDSKTKKPDIAPANTPAVELSEAALDQAAGGAVFPSSPAVGSVKAENALIGLLRPAEKPLV